MNRIEFVRKRPKDKTHSTNTLGEFILSAPAHQGGCHATFVPLHYERNYAYPLLVWLHGEDDSEQQLRQVMPGISVRNYLGVAPRAPQLTGDSGAPADVWGQDPESILASECEITESIASATARFNIARERVFLLGYGRGGTMAMRIAMIRPERFAGVVSIGGAFPKGHTPLARVRQVRRVQILIAHGRQSASYGETAVCADLRLLHSAGMSITLRQYPSHDEITSQMLRDIDNWIMDQVVGTGHDAGENEHLIR